VSAERHRKSKVAALRTADHPILHYKERRVNCLAAIRQAGFVACKE